MQEKIRQLSIPKGYSIRPILIHVNGVKQTVKDSGFFNQIMDFADLLN